MRWYPIGVFLVLAFGMADLFALALYFGEWVDFEARGGAAYVITMVLAVMPALAALLTRLITRENGTSFRMWPLPGAPAAAAVVTMPLLFGVVYLILGLAGWETPQWDFRVLLNQPEIRQMSGAAEGDPAPELPGAGPILFVVGIVGSMALGATVYTLIAAGQEFAWRGFLLPHLLPLGRLPAYLLTTLASLVWWAPLAAAWLLSLPPSGSYASEVVRYALLLALLSLVLCAVADRYRNAGLSAFWLGAFLGQFYGLWDYLFPGSQPPWSGIHGVVGLVAWGIFAGGALIFALVPRRSPAA